MPLITPTCQWCGKKWVKLTQWRFIKKVETVREIYYQAYTSTRFPSVHLHQECAEEMRRVYAKHFPECAFMNDLTDVKRDPAYRTGVDSYSPVHIRIMERPS